MLGSYQINRILLALLIVCFRYVFQNEMCFDVDLLEIREL